MCAFLFDYSLVVCLPLLLSSSLSGVVLVCFLGLGGLIVVLGFLFSENELKVGWVGRRRGSGRSQGRGRL